MAEQTNVDLSKSKPMTDKELEELLRKSDQKAEYPEVKFDEFTVPTTEEWVEACNALLKGKPFDKMMYTKNYEGITFDPIYTLRKWKEILPTDNYPGRGDFLRGSTVNGYVEQPWGIAQACDLTYCMIRWRLLLSGPRKTRRAYAPSWYAAMRSLWAALKASRKSPIPMQSR